MTGSLPSSCIHAVLQPVVALLGLLTNHSLYWLGHTLCCPFCCTRQQARLTTNGFHQWLALTRLAYSLADCHKHPGWPPPALSTQTSCWTHPPAHRQNCNIVCQGHQQHLSRARWIRPSVCRCKAQGALTLCRCQDGTDHAAWLCIVTIAEVWATCVICHPALGDVACVLEAARTAIQLRHHVPVATLRCRYCIEPTKSSQQALVTTILVCVIHADR